MLFSGVERQSVNMGKSCAQFSLLGVGLKENGVQFILSGVYIVQQFSRDQECVVKEKLGSYLLKLELCSVFVECRIRRRGGICGSELHFCGDVAYIIYRNLFWVQKFRFWVKEFFFGKRRYFLDKVVQFLVKEVQLLGKGVQFVGKEVQLLGKGVQFLGKGVQFWLKKFSFWVKSSVIG